MHTLRDYLEEAIASFDDDPADSEFQAGYLAALHEVREYMRRMD